MATPYDDAIGAVKRRITGLTAVLQELERLRSEHGDGTGQLDFSSNLAVVGKNGSEPTNEEAVDRILETGPRTGLGVTEIVDRGPTIGGRELNKNSVRWVLKHGVDAKRYRKRKEGGRAWYSMAHE
jgi:hypothetical protein